MPVFCGVFLVLNVGTHAANVRKLRLRQTIKGTKLYSYNPSAASFRREKESKPK